MELATLYSRTQKFALANLVAFSYFILHAVLSAVLFHIIVSVQDLDLVGKFLVNEPHLKAFTAGLEWQALLRLRIFTFRTPEGKDLPIGVEFFWEKVAKLFEKKIEEKEETKLFEFLKPYKQKYLDLPKTKDIALDYLNLQNFDIGEKAAIRKRFEDARTCEEVMYTFIRFRGLTVFSQRFPLS